MLLVAYFPRTYAGIIHSFHFRDTLNTNFDYKIKLLNNASKLHQYATSSDEMLSVLICNTVIIPTRP